jgi:hypothetical protein
MARIPVTVRCDCGIATAALSGDVVRCSCGRTIDTRGLRSEQLAAAAAITRRTSALTRIGIGVAGLVGVALLLAVGPAAGLAGALVAPVTWLGIAAPAMRRRAVHRIARLAPASVEAADPSRGGRRGTSV